MIQTRRMTSVEVHIERTFEKKKFTEFRKQSMHFQRQQILIKFRLYVPT